MAETVAVAVIRKGGAQQALDQIFQRLVEAIKNHAAANQADVFGLVCQFNGGLALNRVHLLP